MTFTVPLPGVAATRVSSGVRVPVTARPWSVVVGPKLNPLTWSRFDPYTVSDVPPDEGYAAIPLELN